MGRIIGPGPASFKGPAVCRQLLGLPGPAGDEILGVSFPAGL